MIICAIVYGVSMAALGLSQAPWLSALVVGVGIPVVYLGGGSMTNTLLIARWFTARRGRAMMLAGMGMSAGMMIVPPATGYLVETYGWRSALVITGAAIGALLLMCGLVIRDQPGRTDVETPREPITIPRASG